MPDATLFLVASQHKLSAATTSTLFSATYVATTYSLFSPAPHLNDLLLHNLFYNPPLENLPSFTCSKF
jgi:hypothetical protein